MGRGFSSAAAALAAALMIGEAGEAQQAPDGPAGPAQAQNFIDAHCLECHNAEASSAMALFSGLFLDRADIGDVGRDPEVWEKVVRKLRTGLMPPASEPRPDTLEQMRFVTYVEQSLDRHAALNPNPGRPALHRLNRAEYRNAIRDLLALDVDVEALLPADDSSLGFDNMAGALGISPVLIERYSSAASKLSRMAVGDQTAATEQAVYYVDSLLSQARHLEGMPLGTRGGMRVEHFFPLDAEYVIGADLIGDDGGFMGRNSRNEELELAVDGRRVALFDLNPPSRPPPPEPELAEEPEQAETELAQAEAEPELADVPEQAEPELADAPEQAAPGPPEAAPREVRLALAAGPHVITAAFIKKNHAPVEELFQPNENMLIDPLIDGAPDVKTIVPHVSSVAVTGPFEPTGLSDTPSRRKIFVCRPSAQSEEEACAREILQTLATRAYRAPVPTEHLSVLMEFYEQGRGDGGFEDGIALGLQRILSSPQFMFRFEQDPPDATAPYYVDDIELASRLSFFLWSSIPDDELLELALRGRLGNRGVLEQQVERMLADPRAEALTENFLGQWLELRNLDIKGASTLIYPDYDDSLRNSFRRETELLFEHIVRENRSVLELIEADYTFVDERLARHYGIPGVSGSRFRRVPVANEERYGVLGHGSVLLVTSQPNRTSPVNRGVWVLENLLGAHVPTPPNAVPPLEDAAEGVDLDTLSVRELMVLHRSKPFCEGCHKIMDPVGLAMENYDVLGRWRTMDGDTPIDASSQLVDGTEIDGPADLRRALLGYSEQVVRTTTERLLMYGLGRGLEHYDMPVVRAIARDAAADGYRFGDLVTGVVTSAPFRMRAPEGLAAEALDDIQAATSDAQGN